MGRKIYITENKIQLLLKEFVTRKCYHFCEIDTLKKILNNNQFVLRTNIVSQSEHWYQPNRRFFMSVTRNGNPLEGYSQLFFGGNGFARIELDGDALNYNYRARPINYFARGSEDEIYGPSDRQYKSPKSTSKISRGYQTDVENEDRIFSSRPNIPNADRYIVRIDIVPSMNGYISFGEAIYHMLSSISPKWYDKIHIYDTTYDMMKGNENKKIAFPTKMKEKEEDEYEESKVALFSTSALLNLGILKLFVDVTENRRAINPIQYAYNVAKRYRIPIIYREDKTRIRDVYASGLNNANTLEDDYIDAENCYKIIKTENYPSKALPLFEKKVPMLEYQVKQLNTTYANDKNALNAIKAITNEMRALGIDTISLYPKGRDVRGKKITSVWDSIRDKM